LNGKRKLNDEASGSPDSKKNHLSAMGVLNEKMYFVSIIVLPMSKTFVYYK